MSKLTSLYDQHRALNAKMATFADFEMPLQYSTVKDEVFAVRNSIGVFDVSHMGEFFVEGDDAQKFVDYCITNDFMGAGDFKAVYSPMCNEDGTVIDDLIAYKIEDGLVLICVNAANIKKDWEWLNKNISQFNCKLIDRSSDYSLIALQGPKTEEVLKQIGIDNISDLPYYSVTKINYNQSELIMARTGYTGEDGFEIFASHDIINILWRDLISNGVTPCGLIARDILRLEVCFPLYGNELRNDLTPLDSGLKWAVKFNKENFIGKSALENYTPKYRLIKLTTTDKRDIPRSHYKVLNKNGEEIGTVTSGGLSTTNKQGIAYALIEKNKFPEDREFAIKIRNKIATALYTTKPFVIGGHK